MTFDQESAVETAVEEPLPTGDAAPRRRRKIAIIAAIVLASVLVVLALLNAFVVSSFVIQGSSMEPTYRNGDRVWVNRLASPDVGEVVVVRVEALDGREVLKRVAAVGGDTIEITDCELLVDGEVVTAPNGDGPSRRCGPDLEPMTVPDGHVFVLGDNWAGSQDSRQFGPVPASGVVGVVIGS